MPHLVKHVVHLRSLKHKTLLESRMEVISLYVVALPSETVFVSSLHTCKQAAKGKIGQSTSIKTALVSQPKSENGVLASAP